MHTFYKHTGPGLPHIVTQAKPFLPYSPCYDQNHYFLWDGKNTIFDKL